MEKAKSYPQTLFPTTVIEQALAVWRECLKGNEPDEPDEPDEPEFSSMLSVHTGDAEWSFDNIEEFYGAHRNPHREMSMFVSGDRRRTDSPRGYSVYQLSISEIGGSTNVRVTAPSRSEIERVSGVFDAREAEYRSEPERDPQPEPVRVFLGHGRDPQWRDLKDHLHEVHGYEVAAYEVGARAGHTIRDILQEMLASSSFAVLVMTGEDETDGGSLRARQNVVHETGLFQGKLGFSRTVVLLEEGTEDYSNLQGVHQIRYSKGNIKETFGEVLGAIRREFAH